MNLKDLKKVLRASFPLIILVLGIVYAGAAGYGLATKNYSYIEKLLLISSKPSQQELLEKEWLEEVAGFPKVDYDIWTYDLIKNFSIEKMVVRQMVWKENNENGRILKEEFHVFLTYSDGKTYLAENPASPVRNNLLTLYGTAYDIAKQSGRYPVLFQDGGSEIVILRDNLLVRVAKALGISGATGIITLFLMGAVIGIVVFLVRYLTSRGKLRLPPPFKSDISFGDVETPKGVRGIADEIIEMAMYPDVFHSMKVRIPRGFLFAGPRGTGKSLTAAAIAHEVSQAGVTCYNIPCGLLIKDSGADAGVPASRIAHLFQQIKKKNCPCLLIFDEVDIIAQKKERVTHYLASEFSLAFSQFLGELSGLEEYEAKTYKRGELSGSVIVLAITNKPEIIDEDFLRSGRVGKTIEFPLPDEGARKAILEIHARDKNVQKEWLEWLATKTDSFNGADLEEIIRRASHLCVRRIIAKIEKGELIRTSLKKEELMEPMTFEDLQAAYNEVLEVKKPLH